MMETNRRVTIVLLSEGIALCILLIALIWADKLFSNAIAGTLLRAGEFYVALCLVVLLTLLLGNAWESRKNEKQGR